MKRSWAKFGWLFFLPTAAWAAETSAPQDDTPPIHGAGMKNYHAAAASKKLGSNLVLRREDVETRLAASEIALGSARTDEAISAITEVVEHPGFVAFRTTELGRACIMLLGDALLRAGVYSSARDYLRQVIRDKGSFADRAVFGRRAVTRLVDLAVEDGALRGSRAFTEALVDLKSLPEMPDIQGEVAYLEGREAESLMEPSKALSAYARVPASSRHWSQATYLRGLIEVEQGRWSEGEKLFCKLADPKRQPESAAALADRRYYAIRDLARLALGRIAHEQSRFDDSRYYYYLVPRDSDRLAEALYESATSRYEKKDYEGARELLDELFSLKTHHPYEDEARILDVYVDLGRCDFKQADRKLRAFLSHYEPLRDAVRRMHEHPKALVSLGPSLSSRSSQTSSATEELGVSPERSREVLALLRADPSLVVVAKKIAAIEHQESGLRLALRQLGAIDSQLSGVKPSTELVEESGRARAEEAINGARRAIDDLGKAGSPQAPALKKELVELEVKMTPQSASVELPAASQSADLPGLIQSDKVLAEALLKNLASAKDSLLATQGELAKDALFRLDLRLSRLVRRARLARIETVLGKKRALEVEIEAISAGYLPQDAVDSMNASRTLEDHEEYWPFEGDDWPDEFVGGEKSK